MDLTPLTVTQSDISRRRCKPVAPVCDRRISPLIERRYSKWPSPTYVVMYKRALIKRNGGRLCHMEPLDLSSTLQRLAAGNGARPSLLAEKTKDVIF